jgi:hypothetical protein
VEFGTIVDQFQESTFPGCADGAEVCDIDDKFPTTRMLFSLCVFAKKFDYPRLNESTLDHQPALAWAVNDRNLHMPHSSANVRECNTPAKLCRRNHFKFQDGTQIRRNEVKVSIYEF